MRARALQYRDDEYDPPRINISPYLTAATDAYWLQPAAPSACSTDKHCFCSQSDSSQHAVYLMLLTLRRLTAAAADHELFNSSSIKELLSQKRPVLLDGFHNYYCFHHVSCQRPGVRLMLKWMNSFCESC